MMLVVVDDLGDVYRKQNKLAKVSRCMGMSARSVGRRGRDLQIRLKHVYC
jgi:hypothetical protein